MQNPRHVRPTRKVSRRDLLIGAGIAGIAGAGVICGGASTILLALLNRNNPSEAIATQVAANPTATIAEAIQESAIAPAVIPKAEWGGLEPNHNARNERGFFDAEKNPYGWREYEQALTEVYRTVIIHHAAFWDGSDGATLFNIQNLHRLTNGWADVGYHYLIGKTGIIYEGRRINARGAHTAGYNYGSVGVCLLGNFEEEIISIAQLQAARTTVNWLAETLQLTHLAAHKDFNSNTVCPGADTLQYLDSLASGAGLAYGIEGYRPPADLIETAENSPGCACGQHV